MNEEAAPGRFPFRRSLPAYFLAAAAAALIGFGLRDALARFPRGLLTDDAYFYAKIAYNLAVGGISSFDGIHVTDGYHLLWTWILAGVSYVTSWFTGEPGLHLSAMLSVYLFLAAGIGLWFGRSVTGALLLFLLSIASKMLMETTLLALLVLWLAEEMRGRDRPCPPLWRVALPALLIPLARIDGVLLSGVLVVGLLWPPPGLTPGLTPGLAPGLTPGLTPRGARDRRSLMAAAGGASLLGVGLQLLGNHTIAGQWFSVSMVLKSAGWTAVGRNLQGNLTGHYWGGLAAFLLFFLALASTAVALRRAGRPDLRVPAVAAGGADARRAAWTMLAAAALYVLAHLLLNNTMRYWYYVPPLCLIFVALSEGTMGLRFGRRLAMLALACAVAGLAGKYALDSRVRAREIAHARTFVQALEREVPDDALIFQVDGTGYTGFFSRRHVINGDGLVHTHAYARRLAEDGLAGYLSDMGIDYLVTSDYARGDTLLSHHGLVVTRDQVQPLLTPPPSLARLTAFGLYRVR